MRKAGQEKKHCWRGQARPARPRPSHHGRSCPLPTSTQDSLRPCLRLFACLYRCPPLFSIPVRDASESLATAVNVGSYTLLASCLRLHHRTTFVQSSLQPSNILRRPHPRPASSPHPTPALDALQHVLKCYQAVAFTVWRTAIATGRSGLFSLGLPRPTPPSPPCPSQPAN